ncbi:MAG TPA: ROK family protein, partial [Candidatus Sulfotelmatobacter sp.]|nr:ROK family protein [Candidatus Sulfotelmatobacter sp.]
MRVAIGIDVGGTKMLAGLVADDGRILAQTKCPTVRERYMESLEALTEEMISAATAMSVSPIGIGVGTTGLVSHAEGRLVRSMNLNLTDMPIKARLEARFGLKTYADNDLHAATLAELIFGAGRAHKDFVVYNAGTGIAAGMVFGGHLHRGASNVSGEMCHSSVEQHYQPCNCGLPGCLEQIVLDLRKGGEAPPVNLPRAGAPPEPAYGYLALGLIHLINLLNPPAVVLMGGMLTNNPEAVVWLEKAVRAYALPAAVQGLR